MRIKPAFLILLIILPIFSVSAYRMENEETISAPKIHNIHVDESSNSIDAKYHVDKQEQKIFKALNGNSDTKPRFESEWVIGPGTMLLDLLSNGDSVFGVMDYGYVELDLNGSKVTSFYMNNVTKGALFDIDDDEYEEFFLGNSTNIIMFDGEARSILNVTSIRDFVLGDITNNLGYEIGVIDGQYVEVYDRNASLVFSQPSSGANKIYTINWDTDPYCELLLLGQTKIFVIDNDGSVLWSFDAGENVVDIAISDLNGNALDDIVLGCQQKIYVFYDGASIIRENAWGSTITCIGVGDISNDTGMEILVGDCQGIVTVLNISLEKVFSTNLNYLPLTLETYNNDLDQWDEIVVGGQRNMSLVDDNGSIVWSNPTSSNITHICIVNGDIIFQESDWVSCIDGQQNMLWSNRLLGNAKNCVFLNVEKDGLLEIAISFADGTISVFSHDFNEIYTKNLTGIPQFLLSLDSNKDEYEEILVGYSNGTILSINGSGIVWSVDYNGSIKDISVSDIDLDFFEEVVIGGDNGTLTLRYNGSVDWLVDGLNVSSISTGDINSSYSGEEVVAGLVNGTIVIISSDGQVIRSMNLETYPIYDILAYNDRIIYASGNKISAINSTSYMEIWSTQVNGSEITMDLGDVYPCDGLEVLFRSNQSYGIILGNGSIIYSMNISVSHICLGKINGSYEEIIYSIASKLSIDNTRSIFYQKDFDSDLQGVYPIDYDADLIDEIAVGIRIGTAMMYPQRNMWILAPENNTKTNMSNIYVEWKIFGFEPMEYRIYLNTSLVKTTDKSSANINISPDGTWQIKIEAIPTRGSSLHRIIGILVDTVEPSIKILSPQNNTYSMHENVTVVWDGKDSTSGIAYYTLYVNDTMNYNGTKTNHTAMLSYGANIIRVEATDNVGNKNASEILVYMDNISPNITWVNISNDSYFPSTNITVEWDCVEDYLDHYEINIDNQSWIYLGQNNTYRITGLEQGKHEVWIRAYDKAGNIGDIYVMFIVDTKSPAISISSPTNNSYLNKTDILLKLDVSDDNLDLVQVFVDGDSVFSDNVSIVKINIMLNGEGTHNISILAMDRAGNTNISLILIEIDLTPPVILIYEPANGSYINYSEIRVNWYCYDNNTGVDIVQFRIGDNAWGSAPVDMNSTIALKDGSYILYVKAIDLAGNIKIVILEITIDTNPPQIVITSPQNNTLYNMSYIVLSWSIDEINMNETIIYLNGTSFLKISYVQHSLYIWLPRDGLWIITIRAVDLASNSVVVKIVVNIDTTPPKLQILGPDNYTSFYNKSFRVHWNSSDNYGVYGYYIRIDNGSWSFLGNDTEYIVETISLATGLHYLYIMAVDIAGNRKTGLLLFNITRATVIPVEKRIMLPLASLLLLIFAIIGYTFVKKAYKRPLEEESAQE